jgi:hypothetical protein
MNKSEWIAIAAILIASAFSSIQIMLQWLSMHAAPSRVANERKQEPNKTQKAEWLVPRWVLRLLIFTIQTAAIYVLVWEYHTGDPLTRKSVVLITAMAGVVCICFLVPLIIGVYDYMERYFS